MPLWLSTWYTYISPREGCEDLVTVYMVALWRDKIEEYL